jgi:hypothetical protein
MFASENVVSRKAMLQLKLTRFDALDVAFAIVGCT